MNVPKGKITQSKSVRRKKEFLRFSSTIYSLKFMERRRNPLKRSLYLEALKDQNMIQIPAKLVNSGSAFGKNLLPESSLD